MYLVSAKTVDVTKVFSTEILTAKQSGSKSNLGSRSNFGFQGQILVHGQICGSRTNFGSRSNFGSQSNTGCMCFWLRQRIRQKAPLAPSTGLIR